MSKIKDALCRNIDLYLQKAGTDYFVDFSTMKTS